MCACMQVISKRAYWHVPVNVPQLITTEIDTNIIGDPTRNAATQADHTNNVEHVSLHAQLLQLHSRAMAVEGGGGVLPEGE